MVLALRQQLLALQTQFDRTLRTVASSVSFLQQLLPCRVVLCAILDEFAQVTKGKVRFTVITTRHTIVVALVERLELIAEVRRVALFKALRQLVHAQVIESHDGRERMNHRVVPRTHVSVAELAKAFLKEGL